jgi:hypothetical protein
MKRNYLQLFFIFPAIVIFGCFATGNKNDSAAFEINDDANASGVSISISTAHSVPLYKDIHSACTVDIFYSKGMVSRDILSEPYFSFIKGMNFTSLQYSGGSTADHDHVIIGDTLISGGKGDGYNMRPEDAQVRGESFDALLDGAGTIKFGVDFFNAYCALLHKLHIPGAIIANVQSGTLQELYWKIQRSNAKRVIFGMEQSLGSNKYDFPDGAAYKSKISQWIDSVKRKFPGIITVIDAAPVFKNNPKFSAWNQELQDMPADETRLYLWDKDLFAAGTDANTNLATINSALNQTIPQWLEQFSKTFPGKKASVWQWGLKPKTAVYNNMLSCLYIAKFYQFMIEYNKTHNNFIGYASFMSLKSLDRGDDGRGRGDASNMAAALRLCGMLFSGNKKVDDLAITGVNGVTGISLDENGKYTLLLINETGNDVANALITINGKPLEPQVKITTLASSSLDGNPMALNNEGSSTVSLKPYSVNIVEF